MTTATQTRSTITGRQLAAARSRARLKQHELAELLKHSTRGGRVYQVMLLENLVYKRHCGIAVDGIKKYVIDGEKEITINFGDGECDRTFTIMINGVTREITL